MSKLADLLKSHHIQLALATGVSIVVMAYFSKRVLPEPIGYLPSALPPFLMGIYEVVRHRYPNSRASTPWYWVVGILATTALIIALHA